MQGVYFKEKKAREREHAIKNLQKMKQIEQKSAMYSFRFKNGTVITANSPELLEEMKTTLIKQNNWK